MGCCYSTEKPTVYEVTLDNDGVAHHVAEGLGTHYIHVSENNETVLEEKTSVNHKKAELSTQTSLTPSHPSNSRIHPMTTGEKK